MHRPPRMRRRRALLLAVALLSMLSLPAVMPSVAGAAPATISGSPLELTVLDWGNVQAQDPGQDSSLFCCAEGGTEPGGAQFFLGFPDRDASEDVVGSDTHDTRADDQFTPVSQAGGAGTSTPFQVTTVYRADSSAGAQLMEITQTVTYTNGSRQFSVSYAVKNVSPAAIRYRASLGADLFEWGDLPGFGFTSGPPLLVGGQESNSGSFTNGRWIAVEQGTPWSHYQVGKWDTAIWSTIRNPDGAGLNDTVNESSVDHAAAVQWDGHYAPGAGLAPGATENYNVVWKTGTKTAASPKKLTITPASASETVGQSHQISMKADGDYWPLSKKTVRYTVSGANPSAGSVTTNAFGIADKSLAGAKAGEDTVSAFVDLDNDSVKDSNEPAATPARVTWTAATTPGSPGSTPGPKGPSTTPAADSDGDGVANSGDACPTIRATAADGCPPAAGAALTSATRSIRTAFKRLSIKRLVRAGGVSFTFAAPSSGSLSVTGTTSVRGGFAARKLVLLAGKRTFAQAGKGKVKVKLTRRGKRSLRRAKRATIALRMVFKNQAGRAYTKTVKVTLKRR